MKKLFALLLAMTMALSLAACGGNEETPSGSGTGGTSQQEQRAETIPVDSITVENWHEVVKGNYELDIALPDGWAIKEATSQLGTHITFSCNITIEEAFAFFDGIFAELKSLGVIRIEEHGGGEAWDSYSEANDGTNYQPNFDIAMNADWSKSLYIDFGYNEKLNDSGDYYVDEIALYIKADGDWSLPTGDHGYGKFEAYTGMSSVVAPDGYHINIFSTYAEDSVTLGFSTDAAEASEAELDAYAAAIWELSVKAADGGDCFWYHQEGDKITKEYGSVSDAKKSDMQYAWFYKLDGKYVFIKIYRTSDAIYAYAADHVS